MAGKGPGDREGLYGLLWPGLSHLWTNATAALGWLLFFVLNRTTVLGRERVLDEPNTLLLSNHQSMIDSWLVGIAAYYPRSWWKPRVVPWHPAAEENFFDHPALAVLSDLWKAIPIKEGRRDYRALYRMMRALEEGVMVLFPEGTRSRDGSVGRGRPGAGLVVLGNHPTVIPVTIEGMDRVLPIGSRFPRFGQQIYVYFGEPVEYGDFLGRKRDKETAQQLVDRVMDRIREGRRVIERHRGRA